MRWLARKPWLRLKICCIRAIARFASFLEVKTVIEMLLFWPIFTLLACLILITSS